MQLKIDVENSGTHDAFSSDIAELPGRSFIIRPQAEVAGRRWVAQIRAEAGCIGTVVSAGGARVIYASDRKRAGRAALQRNDTAGLPTAGDGVEKPVIDIQYLPLARAHGTALKPRTGSSR
jgi:hypothetical protein